MSDIRPIGFNILPPVVKNVMIISAIMFLATITLEQQGISLIRILGLRIPGSDAFRIYQPVTYLFMHGSFSHLFFNMFSFWMFGATLENYWGSKRFLEYFLLTGLGAAVIHYLVVYFLDIDPQLDLLKQYYATQPNGLGNLMYDEQKQALLNMPNIIGASGAVAGVIVGFGYLFPNSVLYLYLAIPVKAKFLIGFYALYEVYQAIQSLKDTSGDNVAHFAHLGGMIIGILIIKYIYQPNRKRFF